MYIIISNNNGINIFVSYRISWFAAYSHFLNNFGKELLCFPIF